MIGRITGLLLEKFPPLVLVDVQGVGYEIDVPMSTFYNLPAIGTKRRERLGLSSGLWDTQWVAPRPLRLDRSHSQPRSPHACLSRIA